MIETAKYQRKPFEVEGVQVTAENMAEVAEWCQGEIQETSGNTGVEVTEPSKYIHVRVHRAIHPRQTKAFVGDWVLYAGTGYKVYTKKAFENSFVPVKLKDNPKTEEPAKPVVNVVPSPATAFPAV